MNAVWALPLGALLVLLGGFALGNRDQVQSILAVVTGALLQIPLLAVAGIALWRSRGRDPESRGLPLSAPGVWMLAFLLPMVASGGSFLYFDRQIKEFQARSEQAVSNSRAAQETVKMLQGCLWQYRESGYPARLDACSDMAARMTESSGYRFDYLSAVPGNGGRIGAYMLCAQPLSFRATGFGTVVADSTSTYAPGVVVEATLENPPTCASVLGAERVIAWCAYAYAARDPSRGYPRRLADIAACVNEQRKVTEIGADRLTDKEETYAYLADAPDASDRIARFRIYRLGLAGGSALWIDDQLKLSEKKRPGIDMVIDGLPDLAVPERFAPGCNEGRGEDCFVAGYEWQRKARQSGGDDRAPMAVTMREAALKAFSHGCELNEARSCSSLAFEYESGNDTARDVVRAADLYEKACTFGYALGCSRAGEMYESGRKAHVQTLQSPSPPRPSKPDLLRDVARAVAFFGRACELDDRDACFIAGRLLAAGEGIVPDREKALAFFARACNDGMALACSRAANLAPNEEKEFRHRACVLGGADECRQGSLESAQGAHL